MGGQGGQGHLSSSPPSSQFIGDSESIKILGVRGILIMWQLVFASCHALYTKILKGCVMVMADPSDLGHGKK